MKHLFIEMLNSYLTDYGRVDMINKNIDIHSTISLDLNNTFPINIDLSNDDVILWTSFGKYSEMDVQRLSFYFFQFIITGYSSLYQRGQPILYISDGYLVLSATLLERALQEKDFFKQSIEYFYEKSCILYDIINEKK